MSVNYQKNSTDIGTLYAKYADTHNNSIAGSITNPTKTASNFSYNGTDLANTFVKFSDLAPNNMKGTPGTACGFVSNSYGGDIGTYLVQIDTIEYLLRVSLDTPDRTASPVSQVWSILTGAAVFGRVDLIFTTPSIATASYTTSPISISVSANTQYTYYLTPYTLGKVATSNSNTITYWTPPTKPTISGNSTAFSNTSGSAVSFTFAGTYDYVIVYTSSDNSNFSSDNTTYQTGSVYSLPITSVKTTYFYIVPYDKQTTTYNTAYKSDTFTFTVNDGTASLSTYTISSSGFYVKITGSNMKSSKLWITDPVDNSVVFTDNNGEYSTLSSSTLNYVGVDSGLDPNTIYKINVTVLLFSGTEIPLSVQITTPSNVVVGNPTASSISSTAFTVTISATNTASVKDGTNSYTKNGDSWSYTYSSLTANTSYSKTLTITGSDGTTQTKSITQYTQPTVTSLTWNTTSPYSFTSTSDVTFTLTVNGTYSGYKLYTDPAYITLYGTYTSSTANITLTNTSATYTYYAVPLDQSVSSTNYNTALASNTSLMTYAYSAPVATLDANISKIEMNTNGDIVFTSTYTLCDKIVTVFEDVASGTTYVFHVTSSPTFVVSKSSNSTLGIFNISATYTVKYYAVNTTTNQYGPFHYIDFSYTTSGGGGGGGGTTDTTPSITIDSAVGNNIVGGGYNVKITYRNVSKIIFRVNSSAYNGAGSYDSSVTSVTNSTQAYSTTIFLPYPVYNNFPVASNGIVAWGYGDTWNYLTQSQNYTNL